MSQGRSLDYERDCQVGGDHTCLPRMALTCLHLLNRRPKTLSMQYLAAVAKELWIQKDIAHQRPLYCREELSAWDILQKGVSHPKAQSRRGDTVSVGRLRNRT